MLNDTFSIGALFSMATEQLHENSENINHPPLASEPPFPLPRFFSGESSTQSKCVEIRDVKCGPLSLFGADDRYPQQLIDARQKYPEFALKRLGDTRDENEALQQNLLFFTCSVRPGGSNETFMFCMPSRDAVNEDDAKLASEQRRLSRRFPFIPRRGEFIVVYYANRPVNFHRTNLLNSAERHELDLELSEQLILFAVKSTSIKPCAGKINAHGVVQLVDRAPERLTIVDCDAAEGSLGQTFLDEDSAEDCQTMRMTDLHVNDRVLYSAVRNLTKTKFPFRPYRVERLRYTADSVLGRQAAHIIIESDSTPRRPGVCSYRVPKGCIVSSVIAISPFSTNAVQIKGYRVLPPNAARDIDQQQNNLEKRRLFSDPSLAVNNNNNDNGWPLSFLDRSCLVATHPWLVDGMANRRETLPASETQKHIGVGSETHAVAYNSMYKWACTIEPKQTAKLEMKFIAARTGPFRANFALLTHSCEVLVPIEIDVYEVGGRSAGGVPRLLLDTGCFRGQTTCRGLSFEDKFRLYALRQYLHHAQQIAWFDRRGLMMLEASQFTTLDCKFGTQFLLQTKGFLLRSSTRSDGCGEAGSALFGAESTAEFSSSSSTTCDQTGSFSDDDVDSARDTSVAGDDDEKLSVYSSGKSSASLSSLFSDNTPVTKHNFVRLYKLQLQNEAIWRSWQYMEASIRNPRMRLGTRTLYIDMSSNRTFLSHVQRIDEKCFVFLYYMGGDEQVLPEAVISGPNQTPYSKDLPRPFEMRKITSRISADKEPLKFAMVALAVNRVKGNEIACFLPERLQLPFVDYETDPARPAIRQWWNSNPVAADADNAAECDEEEPDAHTTKLPPKYTVFISFKTLMINLRRSYDALKTIERTSLQPAIARLLFPPQLEIKMRNRRDSTCSTGGANEPPAENKPISENGGFGFRARQLSTEKCTKQNCYECPLPHCTLQHGQTNAFSDVNAPAALDAEVNGCTGGRRRHGFIRSDSGCDSSSTDESLSRGLDSTQQSVLDNVAHGCSRPTPYVLIGPPGTGKTRTLVNAILQTFRLDQNSRLLVVASSNVAADLLYTLLTTGKQDVFIPDDPATPTLNPTNAADVDSIDSDYDDDIDEIESPTKNFSSSKNRPPQIDNNNHNVHTTTRHHERASIVSKDEILTPGEDIVRLYSDEHGRSTLIAGNVRQEGIGIKYSEVKSENDDDPNNSNSDNATSSFKNYTESIDQALRVRVCVCTPTLAAHLHRRILDCVSRSFEGKRTARTIHVTELRYRAQPFTHLFVDEAGKCAEAELIVPMLALNLVPLVKNRDECQPDSSFQKRLAWSAATRDMPLPLDVFVMRNVHGLRRAQPPLIVLAGDPYQLGPNAVLRSGKTGRGEDAEEADNFLLPTLASVAKSIRAKKRIGSDELIKWNGVTTSPLTRFFVQYGRVLRHWKNSVGVKNNKFLLKNGNYSSKDGGSAPILMTVLRNNYRNPRKIAEFLSKHFYHGHIVSLVPAAPQCWPSIVLVKHDHLSEARDEGPSVYNVEEARIVADLVMKFVEAKDDVETLELFKQLKTNVAILTPYRNQALTIRIQLFRAFTEYMMYCENTSSLLPRALAEWVKNFTCYQTIADACLPVVATIDEFQGREADNIILSVVRSRYTVPESLGEVLLKHFQDLLQIDASSSLEDKLLCLASVTTPAERDSVSRKYLRRTLGFVADDTRINEAITRACSRLFVVGNQRLLQLCPTWLELLKCAQVYNDDELDQIIL